MKIVTKELSLELWPQIEKLFGSNGACGGCWCMSWRRSKGEDWEKVKGPVAKARFMKLVTTSKAHGALAFVDGEPIGWCSFDRRRDYSRLNRAPSLKCDDADQVWSVPCFFVHKDYRGEGVATALLEHALRTMKRLGAKIIEGYPVNAYKYGKKIPRAFAWTGTRSMFRNAGFTAADNRSGGKQRVRKKIYLKGISHVD